MTLVGPAAEEAGRALVMRSMMLAVAVVFAGAGTVDLFDVDAKGAGIIREGPGGRVDVYDAESRRLGWGRRNSDGSTDLFDVQGSRLGEMRNGKMILKSPSFRQGKEGEQ
jgi:hypothetical protein